MFSSFLVIKPHTWQNKRAFFFREGNNSSMHLLFQKAVVHGFAFSGASYRTWIFVHLAAQ